MGESSRRRFSGGKRFKHKKPWRLFFMTRFRYSFLLAGVGLLVWSCAAPQERDEDADRAEIRRVIESSIAWALTKDKALLDSCFTHDGDLFIYNPGTMEPDLGFEPLEALWKQFWSSDDFTALAFDLRDLRLNLAHSGDVAWFSGVMDDVGEWQGEPSSWMNTRWTGVLERRDQRWVIVQQHFSWVSEAGAD
jgi:ketosteroid isomerase-like protein